MVEVILEAQNCNHWSIDLYQDGHWHCRICPARATLFGMNKKPEPKASLLKNITYILKGFIGLKPEWRF